MKCTLFAGGLLLIALPILVLVPGCGGGSDGIFVPTSTPDATSTALPTGTQTATPVGSQPTTTPTRTSADPTATPMPTPTTTAIPAAAFARLTFTAQNGGNFGTGPYSTDAVSPDESSTPTRIQIYTSGNVNRFFGVILRTSVPLANRQKIPLGGSGSYIFTSASPKSGSSTDSYDNYGGEGLGTGNLQVQRSGNVITLTFSNVVLPHDNTGLAGPAPANSTVTVTGSVRFVLPANAR